MVYVIVVIALVVLLIGAVLIRHKSDQRGISYAPDPNIQPGDGYQALGVRPGPGTLPEVAIATPEVKTEEIAHDEFVADVSDDILDPNNHRHAEWLKEHPGMESETEWVAEHLEENPS
jgi:hypothetical protein